MKLKLPPLPLRRVVRRVVAPPPVPDPGNVRGRKSSAALRLVRRLPIPVVNAPERVVLNFSFMLIGLSAFFANSPGGILSTWPSWVVVAWAACMMVGGASVLYGLWRNETSVERLGYVLVGPSCLLYGLSSVVVRGWVGVPVMLIFLGLAFAKGVRLIISSAERDMTIEYGEKMARDKEVEEEDEI